jgi:hypothetical protein
MAQVVEQVQHPEFKPRYHQKKVSKYKRTSFRPIRESRKRQK